MRDEEQLSLVEVSARQADIFSLTCVTEAGKDRKR